MKKNVLAVWVGLCVSGLVSLSVVAAEPVAPAEEATLAPPPPPIIDEKAAAKAEPRPAAANAQGDPDLEPQVTIIEREDETREEVRIQGVLRYIKVTSKVGLVYYLVPVNGTAGIYLRRDSLDSGLRVPMWQVYSW